MRYARTNPARVWAGISVFQFSTVFPSQFYPGRSSALLLIPSRCGVMIMVMMRCQVMSTLNWAQAGCILRLARSFGILARKHFAFRVVLLQEVELRATCWSLG